jgi:putative ABC transport system substrate-binding protein
MDVVLNRRIPGAGVAWRRCMLLLLLVAPLFPAAAETIVVVSDEENVIHQRFIAGFEQQLNDFASSRTVKYVYRHQLKVAKPILSGASLIVTVGEKVARQVRAQDLNVATINTLVSKYNNNGAPTLIANSKVSSVYIDQPPFRMIALIKAALPEVKTVTVGLGESSRRFSPELTGACQALQVECEIMLMEQTAEIESFMEQAARSDRVLLVLPDPLVINAATVKSLILGAYMRGVALVGYSQALVKAGALMAVHSTPEQLGMDAANMVREAMKNRLQVLPDSRYPRLFSVSVNYQLARALRYKLPTEDILEQRIRRLERNE